MATVQKTFAFLSDAEGFTAVSVAANRTLSWSSTIGNPAGSLEVATSSKNQSAVQSYWEWSGTYEDLGVPAGATVNSVALTSASTRCSTRSVHVTESTIGPYELRDNSSNLIGTLWAGRTATTQEASWVSTPAQTAVSVGGSASNTTVRLRLLDTTATGGGGGTAALAMHDDQIVLTIDYTPPVTPKSASDTSSLAVSDTASVIKNLQIAASDTSSLSVNDAVDRLETDMPWEEVTDAFNDGVVNDLLFKTVQGTNPVTESGGVARITASASTGSDVITQAPFGHKINGSEIVFKLGGTETLVNGENAYFNITLRTSPESLTGQLMFTIYNNGGLNVDAEIGQGGEGNVYSPSTMQWVKIHVSGTVWNLDFSPDGIDWTNFLSIDQGVTYDHGYLRFRVFKGVQTVDPVLTIEDFNLAPTGTTYSETMNESSGSTDSGKDQGLIASRTDNAGVVDSVSSQLLSTTNINGSDSTSLSIADTAAVEKRFSASDTSSLTVTDTTALTKQIVANDTSSVSIADTVATAVSVTVSDTSAVAASDSSQHSVSTSVSDTSSVSASDVASVQVDGGVVGSDISSISVTDTASISVVAPTLDSSAIAIADESAVVKTQPVTDSSGSTDAGTSLGLQASSTDDSGSIDELSHSLDGGSNSPASSDTSSVSITESVSISSTGAVSDTSSISVADSSAISKSAPLGDNSGSTDAGTYVGVKASATDDSGAEDSFSFVNGDSNLLGRTLEDDSGSRDIGVAENTGYTAVETTDSGSVDSLSQRMDRSRADSSSISVADTASVFKDVIVSGSDTTTLAISDTAALFKDIVVADSSTISVSDTGSLGGEANPSASDTSSIAISETTSLFITKSASDTSSVSVNEVVNRDNNLPGSDTAAIGVTEQVSIVVYQTVSDASEIVVTDQAGTSLALSASDTFSLSITDAGTVDEPGVVVKVYVGGQWVIAPVLVFVNGQWKNGVVRKYTGGVWV